jgi:hypothetical protein
MRVLADLHGGDLDNEVAIAEFDEIKDKVQEEVSFSPHSLPSPSDSLLAQFR